MSKRCSTPLPCKFDRHCVHRQIPPNQCNGFFWPNGTGEACQQYELHTAELVSKWGVGKETEDND